MKSLIQYMTPMLLILLLRPCDVGAQVIDAELIRTAIRLENEYNGLLHQLETCNMTVDSLEQHKSMLRDVIRNDSVAKQKLHVAINANQSIIDQQNMMIDSMDKTITNQRRWKRMALVAIPLAFVVGLFVP